MEEETSRWYDDAQPGGPLDAELTKAVPVSCPYCGESVQLVVDPAGGAAQEYVEDCEVCCRPWSVRVSVDAEGLPTASLTTLDDA